MSNRICPNETILSEYLAGCIPEKERDAVEVHLAACAACRRLVAEAYEVAEGAVFYRLKTRVITFFKTYKWLLGALMALSLSFLYRKYFLQFLFVFAVTGFKWVAESRTGRVLVLIKEAWKKNDKDAVEKMLSRFGHNKKG